MEMTPHTSPPRARPHRNTVLSLGLLLAIFTFLTTPSSAADSCIGRTYTLPLQNTTLSIGTPKRGISLSIGAPWQPFSFTPDVSTYNLSVKAIASTPKCRKLPGNPSAEACRYASGGLFDLSVNGGTTQLGAIPADKAFDGRSRLDRVRVGDVEEVWNGFQFVSRFGTGVEPEDQALLGLGVGSTVMEKMVEREWAGGRGWMLDYGMTPGGVSGEEGGWVDGVVTVGGWDKGRVTEGGLGKEIKVPKSGGCVLEVGVTDMVLNQPDGKRTSLITDGEQKMACISTVNPLIQLQPSMFEILNDQYSSRYKYSPDASTNLSISTRYTPKSTLYPYSFFDLEPAFDGNLTITLSNGFTTTIPNSELVKPNREVNDFGQPFINSTKEHERRFLVSRWEEERKRADYAISLGIPFLTAAVVVADYEKMVFRLGVPKRLEGSSEKELKLDINLQMKKSMVPILPIGCPEPKEESETVEKEKEPRSESDGKMKQLGTGAIVGIVVAAVGALVLVILGVWIWRRKRKSVTYVSGEASSVEKYSPEAPMGRVLVDKYREGFHAVEADGGAIPREVPANSAVYELQGDGRCIVKYR